jgi:putative ABC transport system permease protein
MTVWRLIFQEIVHRRLNFSLGLLSVATAVGCLVGALTLLRGHDLRTEAIMAQKEAETAERMQKLEDDYRRITKDMGFNVLILPGEQSLEKFFADGYATEYMPEDYANRLADSKVMTINHLLPSLHQEVEWPEHEQTLATPIVVIRTRGQVPLMHRDAKKPIQEAVPPGTMVVGYRLARSLGLSEGEPATFMGREFTVGKVHPERGDKDDITIWIDLAEAQELLDKEGRINAILALECECEGDRLAQIRAEITGVLPNTQVIEFATKAIARAETRQRAEQAALESLAAERENREAMKRQQESFAAMLVPVVIAGCVVWLGFLSFMNVRARSPEIGNLRAICLR